MDFGLDDDCGGGPGGDPPSPVIFSKAQQRLSSQIAAITSSTPIGSGPSDQARKFTLEHSHLESSDEEEREGSPRKSRHSMARQFMEQLEDSSVFSEDDGIEIPDAEALKKEVKDVLAEESDSFGGGAELLPPRASLSEAVHLGDTDDASVLVEDSISEIADSFAQMSTDEYPPESPAYDRAKDRSRSLLRGPRESPKRAPIMRPHQILKQVAGTPRQAGEKESPSFSFKVKADGTPPCSQKSAGANDQVLNDSPPPASQLPTTDIHKQADLDPTPGKATYFNTNLNLSIFSTGEADSSPGPRVDGGSGESRALERSEVVEEEGSLPDLGNDDIPVSLPRAISETKEEDLDESQEPENDVIDISSGEESEESVAEIGEFASEESGSDSDGGEEIEVSSDEDYVPPDDVPTASRDVVRPRFFDVGKKKADVQDERSQLLEKQKALTTLKARNDLELPDGGFKLDMQLAKVNSELDALRTQPPKETIREQKKAWERMYAEAPVQHRLFGGQMTYGREAEARHVIHDAVHRLHKAIQECPAETEESEDPPGLLIPLMQHQRQGLTWLDWRESQLPRGGILADDMGLGKTLSMIALILRRKQQRKDGTAESDENLSKILAREGLVKSHATLVVCPASLVHQWNSEVEKRTKPGKLRVEIFHGPKNKRERDPQRLARNDIVLTTYTLVAKEIGDQLVPGLDDSMDDRSAAKRNQSVLLQVGWERVILDEAHVIKNHTSKTAKACCRLQAGNRWALTGTPIHNRMMDFFALLRFLRCAPFDEVKVFKDYLNKENCARTGDRVNTVVKALLLRRTKDQKSKDSGKPLVELKEKKFQLHRIALQGAENLVYQRMFSAAQGQAADFLKSQESKDRELVGISTGRLTHRDLGYKNPFTKGFKASKNDQATGQLMMLVLLTRLRQACAHLSLTKEALDVESLKEDELGKEIERELEKELAEGSLDDSLSDLCLKEAKRADYLFLPRYLSAKIKAILQGVDSVLENNSAGVTDKCIVVSQWTSLLDIVEEHLKERGASMTRIDGKVKPADRQDKVESFNRVNRGPRVMLLSLKAGGVGLNLVGANHLFLVDLHWNPALEQQAMDRIYRMGQKKDVFVHKFVCTGTIEERVADLQEKKMQLARGVLEGGGQHLNRLTLGDFKFLFQLDGGKPQPGTQTQQDSGASRRVPPPPPHMAPVFRPKENLTYKWQ